MLAHAPFGADSVQTLSVLPLPHGAEVQRPFAVEGAEPGDVFAARISGVTRFALFVTLRESGASGIVPVSTLPNDFWMHDETAQTLTARRSRLSFRLGQEVEARLTEASPVTGGLVFQLMPSAPNSASTGSRRSSTEGRRSRKR